MSTAIRSGAGSRLTWLSNSPPWTAASIATASSPGSASEASSPRACMSASPSRISSCQRAKAVRGSGAIVNVTTMVASIGMAGMAAYGSSKAAVELLTRAWAAEFGPAGVRVNAVSPGPTRTEGTAVMGENLDNLAGATPLQRVGTPDEVAAGIVFLASDAASLIHGATLPVDGGRLAV